MTQKLFFLFAALFLCLAPPAFAADVKGEIPYRQDSGLSKAEYFIARENYASAIAEAQNVLKRHPESADAYTYVGLSYQRLGDSAKAAEYYRKALRADPAHLGAHKYVADLYLDAGDVARALEQMQALRSVCGDTDCEELNDLERSINAAKTGERKSEKKPAAAPPQRGQSPQR
jgi:tetratricopeptide (TPR) repeat protein